jgi:AraC-like DNA-binding protein
MISVKDSVTLMPKWMQYSTEVVDDTHIIALHFQCYDESAFSEPFVLKKVPPRISELFEAVYLKYTPKDMYNFQCYSLFYELLGEIEKAVDQKRSEGISHRMQKAKKEIEKRFSEDSFNIYELASVLSVNPSYLRREFKKAYSTTPIAYLKKIRIQSAVVMLSSGYYSVAEVAKKCGYSSTSYFVQDFHRLKGCSPLKYKAQYLDG